MLRLGPCRIAAILIATAVLFLVYYTQRTSKIIVLDEHHRPNHLDGSQSTESTSEPVLSGEVSCPEIPGAKDILLVVKTGATEAFSRIPAILSALGDCIPNIAFYSDLDQEIAGHRLYDIVKTVSAQHQKNNPEFDFYHRLQKAYSDGGDLTTLDTSAGEGSQAWTLDKWKNIPMLHEAYTMHPKTKWFVFIDTDTSLAFHNLVRALNKLRHTLPLYIGATNHYDRQMLFAHGGSGYIISASAAADFEKIYTRENIDKWEAETAVTCCGDVMLGKAMSDAGVKLRNASPSLNYANMPELRWSNRTWCEQSWTWHHVQAQLSRELSTFDRDWHTKHAEPFRFKDLFQALVKSRLATVKEDWDNLSTDKVLASWNVQVTDNETSVGDDVDNRSIRGCREACLKDERCIQWTWSADRTCGLGWYLKLGYGVNGDFGTRPAPVSGWIMERVKTLEAEWDRQYCRSF